MRGSCRAALLVAGLLSVRLADAADAGAQGAMHGWAGPQAATGAARAQAAPAGRWVIEKRVYVPSSSMNGVVEGPPLGSHRPLVAGSAPAQSPQLAGAPAGASAPANSDRPADKVAEKAADKPVEKSADKSAEDRRIARHPDPERLGPLAPSVAASRLVQSRPNAGVVLASEVAKGGNAAALTLADVARQAVSWHPNIAEALGRLNQSDEEIAVARAGYYPRVSTGFRAGRDNTNASADSQIRRLSVSASQMLYDFGKVSSSVSAAQAAARVSQARVSMAVEQVAAEAARAAIEVKRYEELEAAARDQVKGVSEISQLVKTRHESGASTRSDVMQTQSRVSASQSIALQYASQLARWRGVLRTLLGVATLPQLSVDRTPELEGACRADELDWPEVPALKVAEAEHERAKALLEAARANRWPTLSLDAGVGRAFNGNATRRDDFMLALNVSMDVYQGGALSARSAAAEHALRAADAARDNARLSVMQALTEAREQTSGLADRLAVLDGRRQSIGEAKELYRQQYLALGTRSLIDLLNAEQEFHQSRFDQINTKYELLELSLDCLYATGAMRRAFGLEDAVRVAGNAYDK